MFNANAQHDNVFGKSKFDTSARTQENISVTSEFHQQPRNIFGAFSSIKTGDKHKSIPETSLSGFDGTISKSSDMPEIQPHRSPLTASAMGHTLTNLPSNIFGSTPRESSQFGTSGKQENIFMSSQSENPPANIFGGVSTLERTFPIVSQTSSTLAVVFCKSNNAPNTNTKAHQSPLTSLMVATGNSNNSLAITAAGIKEEVTQVNSEGNNSGKVAATSFGQAVTSSLSSTFPVKSKPGSAGQGNGFAPAGTYQMIFYRPSSTEKTDYKIHKGPSQSSSFTSSTQTSILGNAGVTHSTSLFSGSNNSTRNVSMNFSAENSANSLGDLTTQGNVFGIAELPPGSTKLSNSSSISNLSKDSNAISGDTPNTGFDGSTLTNQQSIFGSAGLPPTSTLFSSQNLFSVQSTGTFFSNKNKASPSTLSNIDSSMAAKWTPLTQTSLSNATGTPSSASLGNKDQSVGFVNVFGSQQMPSNSFSSNSQRRTVECSQEIETGKILSKERGIF